MTEKKEKKQLKYIWIAIFFAVFSVASVFCASAINASNALNSLEWNGYLIEEYQGNGSIETPYLITKTSELGYLSYQVGNGNSYSGKYFVITNDIVFNMTGSFDSWDISAPEYHWTPIGNAGTKFAGIFDGGNKTISGLYIDNALDNQGLFGYISDATIKNTNINYSYINAWDNVAGIVGNAENNSIILNCQTDNCIIIGNEHVGGIVGKSSNVDILNSVNYAEVEGNSCVGGIVGRTYATNLTYANNYGMITGNSSIGGIAGYTYTTQIFNVSNSGNISCVNGNVGGIAGRAYDTILACMYNVGGIAGEQNVGGLVGDLTNSDMYNSFTKGIIVANSAYGSLVGITTNAIVAYCYYHTDVESGTIQNGNAVFSFDDTSYFVGGSAEVTFYSFTTNNLVEALNMWTAFNQTDDEIYSYFDNTLVFTGVGKYFVTFDMNNADSLSIAAQYLSVGEQVLDPGNPTRIGYTFIGWIVVKDTSMWEFDDTVNSNMILQADWQLDKPNVSFGSYIQTTYTGQGVEIEPTITHVITNMINYYYVWYYKEHYEDEYQTIALTTKMIKIYNVAESGYYMVIVTAKDTDDYSSNEYAEVCVDIEKADLVFQATDYSGKYNGAEHTFGLHITTLGGQTAVVRYGYTEGVYDLTLRPQLTDACDVVIYFKVSAPNHEDEEGSVKITIGKEVLTVTVNRMTIQYNSNIPVYTVGYSGFVRDEDKRVLSIQPTITCSYAKGSIVGTYLITASGAVGKNYDIQYVDALLTVEHAIISYMATGNNISYDAMSHNLNINAVTAGGQTAIIKYKAITGQYTEDDMPEYVNAGEYVVEFMITANYHMDYYGSITFVIEKAVALIDVNASSLIFIYDGNAHNIAVTTNSDGEITYSVANSFTELGEYIVTISVAETQNYKATTIVVVVQIVEPMINNYAWLWVLCTVLGATIIIVALRMIILKRDGIAKK